MDGISSWCMSSSTVERLWPNNKQEKYTAAAAYNNDDNIDNKNYMEQ